MLILLMALQAATAAHVPGWPVPLHSNLRAPSGAVIAADDWQQGLLPPDLTPTVVDSMRQTPGAVAPIDPGRPPDTFRLPRFELALNPPECDLWSDSDSTDVFHNGQWMPIEATFPRFGLSTPPKLMLEPRGRCRDAKGDSIRCACL